MRRLAVALPLPPVAQKWLADYQPEGVVRQLDAHWTGALAAPSMYRVNAVGHGLRDGRRGDSRGRAQRPAGLA